MEFTATSRVPIRPLSYENISMAYKKELVIDYTNGMVYVVDLNGNVISITDQLYNFIVNDPMFSETIVNNIFIKIPKPGYDPESPPDPDNPNDDDKFDLVKLTNQIIQMLLDIDAIKDKAKELEDIVDNITNEDGEIKIDPNDILTDATHQFITSEEKENLKKKIHIVERLITINPTDITNNTVDGEDPYDLTLNINGVDPTYPPPLIDIKYSDKLVEKGEEEDAAFGCMHRVFITGENQARITFAEMPETSFTIKVIINVPGI